MTTTTTTQTKPLDAPEVFILNLLKTKIDFLITQSKPELNTIVVDMVTATCKAWLSTHGG